MFCLPLVLILINGDRVEGRNGEREGGGERQRELNGERGRREREGGRERGSAL